MLCRDVKCVGLNVKRLPAIDLAQRDLSAREQRPKHHAGRIRTRQHALRLDAPVIRKNSIRGCEVSGSAIMA